MAFAKEFDKQQPTAYLERNLRQQLTNPASTLAFALTVLASLGQTHPCLAQTVPTPRPFTGAKAGAETTVGGVKLCWCPAGKFTMGSPRTELERRPGED